MFLWLNSFTGYQKYGEIKYICILKSLQSHTLCPSAVVHRCRSVFVTPSTADVKA